MTVARYGVPAGLDGERVDRAVAVLAGVSRSVARSLIDEGRVEVDGAVVRPGGRLRAGARMLIDLPPAATGLQPERVDFGVVYVDEVLAVIDKPAGVVVHPGAGVKTGTLAAGLLERWPDLEGVGEDGRWGIVHRLDRDTSGLLIVARTEEAHRSLRAALAARRIHRTYLALVAGDFDIERGTVDAPIGRDPRRPTHLRVTAAGRPSRTHYRWLAGWERAGVSLLEVELETGRTHQIRVHLASIGHPVVGDRTYGKGARHGADPGRVWLHACRLVFAHPGDGREIDVQAALPGDLVASLESLGPPDRGKLPA